MARLLRNTCAELIGHRLHVRSERGEEADDIRHRGENAHQLTLAALLESPGGGEADRGDSGHDAESFCHGTEARWQMDEGRFVHGLLQIKDEQVPPDEPDNVIVWWWKRDRARDAPVLCRRGQFGELAAQCGCPCLGAAEVAADVCDGRADVTGRDGLRELRYLIAGRSAVR